MIVEIAALMQEKYVAFDDEKALMRASLLVEAIRKPLTGQIYYIGKQPRPPELAGPLGLVFSDAAVPGLKGNMKHFEAFVLHGLGLHKVGVYWRPKLRGRFKILECELRSVLWSDVERFEFDSYAPKSLPVELMSVRAVLRSGGTVQVGYCPPKRNLLAVAAVESMARAEVTYCLEIHAAHQ